MIVLCKHIATEPRDVFGTTAGVILRKAPCPLVLVTPERGSAPWHLHHILLPHDGTPSTSAALAPAEKIAEQAGAELLVVHVTGFGAAPVEPGSLGAPRYVDQPQHEWPTWTSEFAKRLTSVWPLRHLPCANTTHEWKSRAGNLAPGRRPINGSHGPCLARRLDSPACGNIQRYHCGFA